MEQESVTRPRQRAQWATVVGGLILALTVGLISSLYAGFLGLSVSGKGLDTMRDALVPMITFATAAPFVLIGGIWLTSRRHAPAFAKGVLIGGCISVLASGLCTALIVQ